MCSRSVRVLHCPSPLQLVLKLVDSARSWKAVHSFVCLRCSWGVRVWGRVWDLEWQVEVMGGRVWLGGRGGWSGVGWKDGDVTGRRVHSWWKRTWVGRKSISRMYIYYSILYCISTALYIRLKCLYSVISAIVDWLPGNTKKWTIDKFMAFGVRFFHS